MYCKNCESLLKENQKFCSNCGAANNAINKEEKNDIKTEIKVEKKEEKEPKRKNPLFLILIVVAVTTIILVVIFMFLFSVVSSSSNKLECKSDIGNITILYNEEEIVGYNAVNISYDLDKQKEHAKNIGINAYLDEFYEWFTSNTNGNCTINGKEYLNRTHDNEQNDKNNTDGIVGDKKYGFVTVPKNWIKYQSNDSTALQYSYSSTYIVSLDYIKEETDNTAKQYAENHIKRMKQSSEVSNVTGTTVKIGRNKDYIAYQVSMIYNETGIYSTTYWFKTEDDVIRYVTLEGPTDLNGMKTTDYLHIPESFSLNK